MSLSKDLCEFLGCLNDNQVEYLIVGAHAVGWHGFPRYTGDLDVLVRPNVDNAQRLIHALTQFGFRSLGLRAEDFVAPDQVLQLGRPPARIDVATSITGISFDEAWASRVPGELAGVPVAFVGLDVLIRNKEATGRDKDLLDAAELKRCRDLSGGTGKPQ
jgi:hypothetical protein